MKVSISKNKTFLIDFNSCISEHHATIKIVLIFFYISFDWYGNFEKLSDKLFNICYISDFRFINISIDFFPFSLFKLQISTYYTEIKILFLRISITYNWLHSLISRIKYL